MTIRHACAEGVPVGVVLADAEYGDDTHFRVGVAGLDLSYALAVRCGTSVWPPGLAPLPSAAIPAADADGTLGSSAPTWSGQGRPPQRVRRTSDHQPVSVKALAAAQPLRTWRTVTWREGSQAALSSASLPCASVRLTATKSAANRGRRNGC